MTDNLPATRARAAVDLSQPLTDLEQALTLADHLSRSELVPRALAGKPANVFHVLMTGQALGLHWTESVRVIYSAGPGQIGMRGAFLLSRLRQAGHRYSITEEPESCTFRLTRGDTGEEFVSTFTVEDAIAGGLCTRKDGKIVALSRDGKPLPWQSWTKRMLRWRAVADGVGFGAPEVALGFEIEGSGPADPRPEVTLTPQTPAPPEPAAGQAAPVARQAAQAEQLAHMDRQMRGPADVPGRAEDTGRPAGDHHPAEPEMGGNPADSQVGGNAPPEPGPDSAPDATPPVQPPDPAMQRALAEQAAQRSTLGQGRRSMESGLTQLFTELGWPPARFPADVLRACSMFAGRRVRSVRELQLSEMRALSAALRKIATEHESEHQVVVLADQAEAWREKFAETNPKGYEAYEAGA